MPCGAAGALFDDTPARQEIEAGQQIGFAERGQDFAGLGRFALVAGPARLCWLTGPVFDTLGGYIAGGWLATFAVLAAEGIHPRFAALAPSFGFAANLGEALHALAVGGHRQMELAIQIVVMLQWHGALGVENETDGPVDAADPERHFIGIADGGREANQRDMLRRVDNGLFPDRPALRVAEVVQFIEDNAANISQFSIKAIDWRGLVFL